LQDNNKLIINRLTALWALNECGIGGFMHAFRSPFTGIIVGGVSILLITLIASYATNLRSTLIKALSIVLLVKLSVSPHSPIPAYLAVSFQGILGMVLFSLLPVNKATIIFLGVLTYLESAFQKVIVLTIIYGQSLWNAIDSYGVWISTNFNFLSLNISSKHLILVYLIFYGVSGFLVGLIIVKVHVAVHSIKMPDNFNPPLLDIATNSKTKRPKKKMNLILFWCITLVVILIPLLFFNSKNNGWKTGLYVVARSLIIIGTWYIIIGPLILNLLNKFLQKRRSQYQTELQQTLLLLPHLKSIVNYVWKESKSLKGLNRIQYFISRSIVYSFHFKTSK